jgi:hypothetical protein
MRCCASRAGSKTYCVLKEDPTFHAWIVAWMIMLWSSSCWLLAFLYDVGSLIDDSVAGVSKTIVAVSGSCG